MTSAVRRDVSGHVVPVRTIAAQRFSGACTIAEGSGYLLDVALSASRARSASSTPPFEP